MCCVIGSVTSNAGFHDDHRALELQMKVGARRVQCRSDLTRGVRASAASVVAAEAALRHGAAAARGAVTLHLLPAARRGAPAVRGAAVD